LERAPTPPEQCPNGKGIVNPEGECIGVVTFVIPIVLVLVVVLVLDGERVPKESLD
jgi:hypothetical protein